MERLTELNFVLMAAKHYDNPQCHNTDEFYDDLKRFVYIKRLFGKYEETGELKERLILNHIIILYNMFGKFATNMLFQKLPNYHSYIKPFVVLLGFMPDKIVGISDSPLYSSDILMDPNIVEALRKI